MTRQAGRIRQTNPGSDRQIQDQTDKSRHFENILGNTCQKAAPRSPFGPWGTPRTVNERSDARSGLLARIT